MTDLTIRPNPAVTFAVLHEDADLLIIDKPAGLVVQPGKGHTADTLLNGVFAMKDGFYGKLLHNLGVRRDFGLLHRLDKETSGLLVVAKTPNAYDQLRRDFESRHIEKEYLTLVLGKPVPPQGVIQARLKETTVPTAGGGTVKKVIISRQGQEAISAYQTLATATHASGPAVSLLRVRIKTGRLHQIRAHMLYLQTPVLGDDLYILPSANAGGTSRAALRPPRLCLHAAHLAFTHPILKRFVHFESPLPPDLVAYAHKVGLPPL